MVKRPYKRNDEPPDELSYESFDDEPWDADAEIDAIRLDELDDAIPEESGASSDEPNEVAANLLETIDHLDQAPDLLAENTDSAPEAAPESPPDEAESITDEIEPTPEVADSTTEITGENEDETSTPVESAEIRPESESVAETEPTPPEAASVNVQAAPTESIEIAPVEEAPVAEVDAASEAVAETSEAEAPAEPEPPPEVLCVLLPLPPELHSQIVKLRKLGKIATMPPPGIALTAPFLTQERPAVETALAKWTRAHLPVQLEITSVLAKVIGAQQYIAGWALEPEEELLDAQHELRQALADLILPVPGAAGTFNAWLLVGDHVAAGRFPQVIGQMQHDFEPFVWHANDLQLVKQGEPWETVITFD